ncbi:S8 family serine peptidase [Natronococcus sp. A-GB1]|uniref:S8 family serine peptidase n=1 Tax=Natronococcus sp. A-GB1 TaxID=3037648 RepID=UPI00241F7DC5|nr:S8 family serine peptidase [Natronococcus sp. A-GB1]MDG5758927.1 S8 family serine peptidase [Natronococcus sp. A-GB1]
MSPGSGADRLATRPRVVLLALVLVVGLVPGAAVGSIGVPAGPMAGIDDPTAGVDDATAAETPIDPALEDAEGEVTVLVHLESPPAEGGEEPADRRTQAEASHDRFDRGAASDDAVTVEREFWLTTAVLATVDTDRMDLETLAQADGVSAVSADEAVSGSSDRVVDDADADADADVDGEASESDGPSAGLEQLNVPEAWDTYRTEGEGTSVAVLDSGVDGDPPDLDVAEWRDFGDDPSDEPIAYDDHGTHVSGVVAGGNESGTQIGVAPEADLYHGAVMTHCEGEDCVGYQRDIIAGLEWAVEADADVIVLSLGIEGYNPGLLEAIENANEAGTPVVSSAGNQGAGTSTSPGNLHATTSVGAVDETDTVPEFSSSERIETAETWGSDAPEHWPGSYEVPTLVAPGVDVTSTAPGGGYTTKSGTSMAAPAAGGAAALVQSATATTLDATELETALTETAVGGDGQHNGHGVIDVPAAIERAGSYSTIEGTATDTVTDAPLEETTVTAAADGDRHETTTDSEGAFEFEGLEADREYEVVAEGSGYEPTSETATPPADGSATVDLSLAGSGTIDVDLADEQFETPVDGGTVAATGPTGSYPGERTDDGSYRIDAVPGDEEYALEVDAPGRLADERTVAVDGSETRPESFDMRGDSTLEVAVETGDGDPVENASVVVEVESGETLEPDERTAADGTLEVAVPGTGQEYTVTASGSALESTTAETGAIDEGTTETVVVAPTEGSSGGPAPIVLAAAGVVVAVGVARLARS